MLEKPVTAFFLCCIQSAELCEGQEIHSFNVTTSKCRSRQLLRLSCIRTCQRPLIFHLCSHWVLLSFQKADKKLSCCVVNVFDNSVHWLWEEMPGVVLCFIVHPIFDTLQCIISIHVLKDVDCLHILASLLKRTTPSLYALYIVCTVVTIWTAWTLIVVQTRQLQNDGLIFFSFKDGFTILL